MRWSLRPDSIDLLFLGSFPDAFERVEREKDKNKRKKMQTFDWKYNNLRKKFYLIFFFSFPFHERTGGSEKQQINWVWPYMDIVLHIVLYILDVWVGWRQFSTSLPVKRGGGTYQSFYSSHYILKSKHFKQQQQGGHEQMNGDILFSLHKYCTSWIFECMISFSDMRPKQFCWMK